MSVKPNKEDSANLSRWANRWAISKLGWHKSDPHHYLVKHGSRVIPGLFADKKVADSHTCAEKSRVLVPLCGKTVDMKFLAETDAVSEVVGVDGIQKALEEFASENPSLEIKQEQVEGGNTGFERFVGTNINLLQGDFFDIDEDTAGGQFDVILDRASIVAIDPSLRKEYVSIMGKLIKPGGSILLITIDRRTGSEEGKSAGPPFSVDDAEIHRLYGNVDWVDQITKLDEHNEFETEEDKKRWTMQGVDSLFELCYVIQARG